MEGEEFFLLHTYLSSLAKLLVYVSFVVGTTPDAATVQSVLSGDAFKEWGIMNFIEEDFFSWMGGHRRGVALAQDISERLFQFRRLEMERDFLPAVYEDLLSPENRLQLKEYYTPGWFAQRMTRFLLQDDPMKRFLDPACGAGVYLAAGIGYKIRHVPLMGGNLLHHILQSVIGIDINPIAIIMAKANYLLALRPLLKCVPGPVSVPVYLADSLHPPQVTTVNGVKAYEKVVDKETTLYLPVLDDPEAMDQMVEAVSHYALDLAQRAERKPDIVRYLTSMSRIAPLLNGDQLSKGLLLTLQRTGQTLSQIIADQQGRRALWAFILKNCYKPLFLLHRFDVVVGVSAVPPMAPLDD